MALSFERLSNDDVDALAGFMEAVTKPGKPPVFSSFALSNDPARKLGIMRVVDFPRPGLTTAITFGLMHYSFAAANFPDRIELLMVLDRPDIPFEKILVVVADMAVATASFPKPGSMFGDACKMARVPGFDDMKPHALAMFPFLWRDGLTKATLPHAKIWFHQIVPIFDDERAFIETNDFATFEELLSFDVLDLQNAGRGSHIIA